MKKINLFIVFFQNLYYRLSKIFEKRQAMENIRKNYDKLLEDNGGIYFPGIIDDEKKSDNFLTPIFENITNAFEAIKLKNKQNRYNKDDYVHISLFFLEDDSHNKKLERIDIEDTGLGFTYEQFFSFTTYKYNQKGFNNKGCGRFQSLLFFDSCQYNSIFKNDNDFYKFSFDFSKVYTSSKGVNIKSLNKIEAKRTGTVVSLFPASDDVTFDIIDLKFLKNEVIKKYALEFLLHSEGIPEIEIKSFVNDTLNEIVNVQKGIDVPTEKKETTFCLPYRRLSNDAEIEQTNDKIDFKLTIVPFDMNILDNNEVYICSKNETIKNIEFNAFAKDDSLNNQRFLIFVSSDIFERSSNIDNCRRDIKNILKTEEQIFQINSKKQAFLFNTFVLQEDLENAVTDCFYSLYPIARSKEITKQQRINSLKELFGLEENSRLSIKTSDTSRVILEKYYRSEALKQANLDAAFSEIYEKIISLDINSDDYDKKISKLNNELNEKIPLRNKRALSKYLTNRKIVLDLFNLTIQKRLFSCNLNLKIV